MRKYLFVPLMLLFLPNFVYADKGPIIWREGVALSQESQKAIILHNSREEILILGTELRASKEMEVLEFIPFPSEPQVGLARGAPFEKIAELIKKKGLVFRLEKFTRGGSGGKTTPVEIRLSEKIGLHDVTTLKVNDIGQFSGWLDDFFKSKGIHADKKKLANVYSNVEDYVGRGIDYFVFDRVMVSKNVRFIEPLVYRFRSNNIYYPLKTSNLIGGRGVVELILVLPGSIPGQTGQAFFTGPGADIKLSSSSKVYPGEVEAIYGSKSQPFFDRTSKIYLQVLRYSGPYNFRNDFTYDIGKLTAYAYRYKKETVPSWLSEHRPGMEQMTKLIPPLTADEKRDMREVFCSKSDPENFLSGQRYGLDCWNFIPNVEYEVYTAIFKSKVLEGIPSGRVVVENTTVSKEYGGRKIDSVLQKDFNKKNRVAYPLEHAFIRDDRVQIRLRSDADGSRLKGKTSVSRVGFNQDGSSAMVYVEHIAGTDARVSYYVVLAKKSGKWRIVFSERVSGNRINDHGFLTTNYKPKEDPWTQRKS